MTTLIVMLMLSGELEDAKGRFDDALKAMNEKCKTNITATYDLKSEKYERERYDSANKKWFLEPNRDSGQFKLEKGFGYDLCKCAFEGIAGNCDKDTFKAFLAAKVKTISCEHRFLNKYETELLANWDKNHKLPDGMQAWEAEGSAKDSIRHEYKDGTLKTFVDPDMSNCGQYSSRYLTRTLGFEDLEEKADAKEKWEEALKTMNEKCGTSITATYAFDKEFYERERYDSANKKWVMEPNPPGGQWRLKPGWGWRYSQCAFEGIQQNCDKDTFKATLAKKVKSIACEPKHLHKFEQEMDEAYQKTHKLPHGYEKWEVDAQRDGIRQELKAGKLEVTVDPDMSNCGNFTAKWLLKKL